eukprot:TRINITY_DN15085_c0_g1_i1.p1 TRINITY_DN15085_c0_g1~~TRINITY_DN15085_c0_g1_i1.p1  ORF type:complete len:150 (+),score=53.03 TRINITY_DN15085_c0_g1_i1:43-450(+)
MENKAMNNELKETIEDFVMSLESYTPVIPDEVIEFYLKKTGFNCPDIRIKRLISLAAQKFVSDIANDSLQYCKMRQSRRKDKKHTLTMEDLSQSLREYGINTNKPEYFADRPSNTALTANTSSLTSSLNKDLKKK